RYRRRPGQASTAVRSSVSQRHGLPPPTMAAMIRGSAAFRRMTWLALVAVLLGAVVPTVSRAVASAVPGAVPLLMEMCTPAGRKMMDVSRLVADWGEPAPAPPAAAMDEACGYCVLAPPSASAIAAQPARPGRACAPGPALIHKPILFPAAAVPLLVHWSPHVDRCIARDVAYVAPGGGRSGRHRSAFPVHRSG